MNDEKEVSKVFQNERHLNSDHRHHHVYLKVSRKAGSPRNWLPIKAAEKITVENQKHK